jgi:hypothetical protein
MSPAMLQAGMSLMGGGGGGGGAPGGAPSLTISTSSSAKSGDIRHDGSGWSVSVGSGSAGGALGGLNTEAALILAGAVLLAVLAFKKGGR